MLSADCRRLLGNEVVNYEFYIDHTGYPKGGQEAKKKGQGISQMGETGKV